MNQTSSSDSSRPDDESPNYVARILKGSGAVFSGSMVAKVIGFALQIVLSRGLGPALYGVYSLGHVVLQVARDIGTLGLQNGVVRFGAPQHETGETSKLKGTFLATAGLGGAAGLVIGVLLFLLAPWLSARLFGAGEYTQVLQIFAVGLPFYVLTYLLSRMARTMGKMQLDVLLGSILQPTLFLLLTAGLLLSGQGLVPVLYAFLGSTILAAAASLYAIYRLFPPLLSSLAPYFEIRALLRFSLPIIGVSLASIGLTYADRVMLGMFGAAEDVGIYQAAAKMSVQMRFVLFAVTATFSPIISDLYHNDKRDALNRLYADTVRWIFLLTLPASVLLITFAPQVMAIFGPDFRAGANLLRILAVAYFLVAAVGSVGQMLQMTDHQDAVLGFDVSMAVANVGLNWILIQWYGAIGAAVATGLTQAAGNFVQIGALYHFTGIQPFRRALWKPLAATGVAGVLGWLAYTTLPPPYHWAAGVPIVLLSYGGAVLLFGLHPRDRSIAEGLWAQLRGGSPSS
jgi:O-antigen/teichoic acid export membrane protein